MTTAQQRLELGVGDHVFKSGAGYAGPGIVYGIFEGEDNHTRYVVGHKIDGGKGTFYHIYGASQLTSKERPDAVGG